MEVGSCPAVKVEVAAFQGRQPGQRRAAGRAGVTRSEATVFIPASQLPALQPDLKTLIGQLQDGCWWKLTKENQFS